MASRIQPPWRLFWTPCAIALGVGVVARQSPLPPAQQPRASFRTGVDLVQVDVSVLDANRRPVHGLTAADFTLTEDGVPQTIDVVSEVNVPDVEEGAPWIRDVAPDVRSNSAEDGRVILFPLDDTLTNAAARRDL